MEWKLENESNYWLECYLVPVAMSVTFPGNIFLIGVLKFHPYLFHNFQIFKTTKFYFWIFFFPYFRVDEYWEPQIEGLEEIVASRQIPCIHILLSLDEIDPKTPGYQSSKTKTTFWLENAGRKLNSDQGVTKKTNRKDNYKKPKNILNKTTWFWYLI